MTSGSLDPASRPGFWRRIKLFPARGRISAGVEDNFHRFLLRMTHSDGVIENLETSTQRFPWATCGNSGAFLRAQAIGKSLRAVAGLDARSQCTHLFELLVVCAAHALDEASTQLDIRVPDRQDQRTSATLEEDGQLVLRWEIDGLLIVGPGEYAGRDLRRFSTWKQSLTPAMMERAMLLRRAVHVSNARARKDEVLQRASDRGPERMGACFTYQMPRALEAWRSPDGVREFAETSSEPLQDFDGSI